MQGELKKYKGCPVHRIHTRSVSQAQITCVLVAQVRLAVSSLCARRESVIRSAMSSPCWSLPHLLTSSPPQHEAPSGQHDLLQDDTAHRTPLSKPIQSTGSAKEPLSYVDVTSNESLVHVHLQLFRRRASIVDNTTDLNYSSRHSRA